VSEFSAWRGQAHACWVLSPERTGEAQAEANDPLRALYKLRRRIPKPIRPSRRRMYQLCWEAVYVNHEHDIWVTRTIDWLHREHRITLDGEAVILEVSIRIAQM
jgi:hypothetical protein